MAFIVFEGIDGSGKSTLIQHLDQFLRSEGRSSCLTREPGGTPLAERIRELLIQVNGEPPCHRAELLLYEAARSQHVENVIRPALERGQWVLCDRFTASTLAFQSGGRGLDEEPILWLNDYATGQLKPDLNVLLDLPVEKAFQRRMKRYGDQVEQQDRFEREKKKFHVDVRNHYLLQAHKDPQSWLVLDGDQSPEHLLAQLKEELLQKQWLN